MDKYFGCELKTELKCQLMHTLNRSVLFPPAVSLAIENHTKV